MIGVDEQQRLPIGRPWITRAIDVYSRMVLGFYISQDPPGALGQCIAHAALPKEAWLAKRGIVGSWPCWGFPARIHLDNAKEFHGEMLRRACEQYGVRRALRQARRADYPRGPAPCGATIRNTLGHASLSTTDVYLSSAPTDGSSLYLRF